MKKSTITEDKAEHTPTGGVLVGKRKGQTIIHNKGTLSGYLVGKTHAEGGIKAVNKSTGQPLEMQGGEVVITAPAVSDNTKREFDGKMMTNREILSTINEKGGGVSFAKGGDVPQSIKHTGASYKYGGKIMTDHEILKHITGGHLAEGYSIREIAEIHQVPLSDLKKQVRLGMEAESEHTSSKREQMQIVKDHLFENPEYYTLLKKSGLEDGGGIHSGSLVKDSKSGNTPARDLNNYNDVMDLQADNMVGAETGLFEVGGKVYKARYRIIDSNGRVKYTGGTETGSWFSLERAKELVNRANGEMIYEYNYNGDMLWEVFEDGGMMKNGGLIAPNGKKSNLTPEQYKLVRTPEFKEWFGYWENDPENASKVVDENGEPLVVYHFSDIEFNVFEVKGLSDGFFFTKNIEDEEFSQKGWLKSKGLTYEQAKEKGYDLKYEKGKPYFLNIKQFFTEKNVKKQFWSTPYFENRVIEFAKRNKKNDGVEFLREIDNKQIIVAFEPNQIKLADGTNTKFNNMNPDIRYADGGDVKPYDANMEGDSVDMMFADGGAVSSVVKNWNEVPSIWKDTSKIKKVVFTNSPYDKGLYSIVAPFLGKDDLRPIFGGINFDENGITVTNAHVLITLPYPSKQFEGVYEADLSKKANPEQITIEGNYPNYSPVIPKKEVTKPFFIDVYKLLQYNNVAMKFANKTTNAVNYKIEDEIAGFNAKFLNESLKTLLKLGHDKAYAHYIAPNKALLLSPSEDYEIGNDELVLTMPVMVQNQSYGAEDLDYGRGLKVYYDFNDNEIHNADGSIADFKMKYEQNSPIDKDDVNLLQKLANGKQRLEILNSVLVENGLARASDLETEYYLSGVDLPNGIYKPIQGALEITMEAIEDFPTPPIFVTDEDTLQFVISSDILEYYIDKLKYVVGQDDLRPVMQGICLHHTSDNKLFLAGTDAHILLKVNITEYVDMPVYNKEMKFIIQPKRLYDFLNSTENTALTIKSNLVSTSIQSDNWSFYARNIDGNYPNYDAVMPKETTKLAVVNLEPIKKAFNTEMVKNYVREASSKDKVFIFNEENEIFIATYSSGDNIEKICETNVDFSLKDYYNENQSVLLFMPFGYGKQTNFAFRKDLVDRVLKIVNDNKLELHYTELNRPYLIPIHSFEYKTTTKEHKVKEQKPSIAEIKLVSTINEVNEIKEAIETLEMLSETATRKDKKEIKEAVEVLQMLLDTYEY